MEKVAAIIALLSTIASAAFAFLKLGTTPLDARLAIVGVLGVAAIASFALWLRDWTLNEARARNTGFIRALRKMKATLAARRGVRIAVSVVALGVAVLVVVFFLRITVTYHSIVYGPSNSNVPSDLRFAASRTTAALVSVDYPQATVSQCTAFDPDAAHPAAVVLVAPAGPKPRAELTNFVYPQTFGLRCDPTVPLTRLSVRVVPPEIRALDSETVQELGRKFNWGGLVIWLVASAVSGLSFRSRS